MPGGQVTNLRAQARSMGLEGRWPEVAETYSQVNQMFGDIIKVTPTSKVVGDMALSMVAGGLTRAEVEDPASGRLVSRLGDRADAGRARPADGRLSEGHPDARR